MPVHLFVYIIRSPALLARDKNVATLQRLCAASPFNVAVSVVTGQEPGDLTPDLIKTIVDITPSADVAQFAPLLKPLHVAQLSNNLKHFTALRMITENGKEHPGAAHVVVEDDVLFNEDAISMLMNTIKAAPAAYDLILLGLPSTKNGTLKEITFEPSSNVFKHLPCCDSYVVTTKAAAFLIKNYLPVRLPTHIQLTYLMQKGELGAFICSPNVFIDGSKLGAFMSSIEQDNALIWNPQYNRLRSILSSDDDNTLGEVDALLTVTHFREHPDFKYLAGKAHVRCGRYEQARKEFDSAFDIYVTEKCILGPQSQFMKDYVKLFRHLQA